MHYTGSIRLNFVVRSFESSRVVSCHRHVNAAALSSQFQVCAAYTTVIRQDCSALLIRMAYAYGRMEFSFECSLRVCAPVPATEERVLSHSHTVQLQYIKPVSSLIIRIETYFGFRIRIPALFRLPLHFGSQSQLFRSTLELSFPVRSAHVIHLIFRGPAHVPSRSYSFGIFAHFTRRSQSFSSALEFLDAIPSAHSSIFSRIFHNQYSVFATDKQER